MRPETEHEYVEFVTARLAGLHRLAYQLSGDAHRADDLVQQTCTNLYVYWRRARAADNLDAYVRTMLVKAFLDEKRRGWSRVELSESVAERVMCAGDLAEDRTVLREALGQVPPRQRAVLVLRYLCDLSVNEVAEMLGCSTGTVKSQSSHGATLAPTAAVDKSTGRAIHTKQASRRRERLTKL